MLTAAAAADTTIRQALALIKHADPECWQAIHDTPHKIDVGETDFFFNYMEGVMASTSQETHNITMYMDFTRAVAEDVGIDAVTLTADNLTHEMYHSLYAQVGDKDSKAEPPAYAAGIALSDKIDHAYAIERLRNVPPEFTRATKRILASRGVSL